MNRSSSGGLDGFSSRSKSMGIDGGDVLADLLTDVLVGAEGVLVSSEERSNTPFNLSEVPPPVGEDSLKGRLVNRPTDGLTGSSASSSLSENLSIDGEEVVEEVTLKVS